MSFNQALDEAYYYDYDRTNQSCYEPKKSYHDFDHLYAILACPKKLSLSCKEDAKMLILTG